MDSRYFRYFDWFSFLLITIIAGIGLLFVFSATYRPDMPYSIFFRKQLFGIISGFILYFALCIADYRTLARWGYLLYIAVIGLLLFTIIKGSIGMGAQRWITLGFFKFQPSELAKVLFPAFMAHYLYSIKETDVYEFKQIAPLLGVLLVSTLLILKQPDLGTALIVLFSGTILCWLAGLTRRFFIITGILVIITAPISWHFLKPYQKKRITVFLGQGEMHKERYQIEQSKIAIGSGGLTGKGFLHGTQNKFMFLPESRTDFIFSVLCEEWGFVGAATMLLLYTLLFIRLFMLICTFSTLFAQILGTGLVIHIFLSTVINICMVTALLPIVGIPLPFMSYGITNLWVSFASLGWFQGIVIRRFYIGE
jgi:rod shape determining protein RodA